MQPLEPPQRSEPAVPTPGGPSDVAASVEPGRSVEPGPLGDLVAAHFRRVQVAMLGQILITTLAGALPPSIARVQRHRTWWQWLLRRPGRQIGITITARDRVLSLQAPAVGVCQTSAGDAVRGVVLSSSPVPVSRWLDELGELLNQVTSQDEATRAALERALLR